MLQHTQKPLQVSDLLFTSVHEIFQLFKLLLCRESLLVTLGLHKKQKDTSSARMFDPTCSHRHSHLTWLALTR